MYLEQKTFIEKFGSKPRVYHMTDTPYVVREYWKKQYKHPEAIEELRCTPVKQSPKGWMTVCDYRTHEDGERNTLNQDVYYINNDVVILK
ncbi:hypothetical protein ACM66Z_05400 [Sulfurovum sp. ST-21]|uniref:Uncharacterized protein n=1 Tax=Sulfurovum indicum TaxID=2779528 RepID=A0A7M1S700_9BACT|nr:hypothetical protein [Sulfurovum indicum]QOR62892.1 hypothetical protein IMZ28_05360 [Sulfurovum indicum]